ncbi:MAG: hypothetical protein A2014_05285 [Spirochaetes bacterium GWF1_49_6]|nr:MAG: hypothetical protein A2014_05285 [Spirochaetes bacterium GWF1_49_6]
MEVLRGKATNVKSEFVGTESGRHQVVLFELEGKPVVVKDKYYGNEVIIINETDDVAVAGMKKNGVFYVIAYKNFTKDVLGTCFNRFEIKPMLLIGGIGMLMMCLAAVIGITLNKYDYAGIFIPMSIIGVLTLVLSISYSFNMKAKAKKLLD